MRFRYRGLTSFIAASLTALAVTVVSLQLAERAGESFVTMLSQTYSAVSGLVGPLFKLAGLAIPHTALGGLYTLFLLVYVQGLFFSVRGTQSLMRQQEVLNFAWGPAKKPGLRKWLLGAGISVAGMAGLALAPALPPSGYEGVLLNCLRLATFLGFGVSTIVCAVMGWQQYLLAARASKEARDLTLRHSIYLALAAEMIHAIGSTDRLPHPTELELSLSQLRELASHSHDDQFDYGDLGLICHRAIELLDSGELTSLPDVFAIKKLYYRPDPAALYDIATELQQRIEQDNNDENAAAPLPPAQIVDQPVGQRLDETLPEPMPSLLTLPKGDKI